MQAMYRGRIIITEEAVSQFWPDRAKVGFIKDAQLVDGNIELTWGALNVVPSKSQLSWSEVKAQIGLHLPSPVAAVNTPQRDAFCLVFRDENPSDHLRERLGNGDIYEIGILTSEGFQSLE